MAHDLLCVDCLTDKGDEVPAVTAFAGFLVCADCAKQRDENLRSIGNFQPPPIPTRFNPLGDR